MCRLLDRPAGGGRGEEVLPSDPRADAEDVSRLGRFIDLLAFRHPPMGAHCRRVGLLSGELALLAGLDPLRARAVRLAASVHDIGKLAVPDAVLLKRGPLGASEQAMLRRHPRLGHDLLATVDSPLFALAALIALRHHERLDGSGYPDGLAAAEIPLAVRIVSIADCFEALVGERTYRAALSPAAALAVMREESGAHLDPGLVELFALCPALVAAGPSGSSRPTSGSSG